MSGAYNLIGCGVWFSGNSYVVAKESLKCALASVKRALDISQLFSDEYSVHSSAVLSEMPGPPQGRLSLLHGARMRTFCSSQQDKCTAVFCTTRRRKCLC